MSKHRLDHFHQPTKKICINTFFNLSEHIWRQLRFLMIIQYSESNKSTIKVTDLKYISTNKGVKNVTVTYKKYGKLPIIILLNRITLKLNEMTSFIMREM